MSNAHTCEWCGSNLTRRNSGIDINKNDNFVKVDLYQCIQCGRLCYIDQN